MATFICSLLVVTLNTNSGYVIVATISRRDRRSRSSGRRGGRRRVVQRARCVALIIYIQHGVRDRPLITTENLRNGRPTRASYTLLNPLITV